MSTCRCVLGAAALLLLLAGIARAETVTLDASDRGWYLHGDSDTGFHNPAWTSYLAGRYTDDGFTDVYRNFYVFDLTGIADNITSATLKVFTLGVTEGGGIYELYHVATSVDGVDGLTTGGYGKETIFDDLGSGTSYGSLTISDSEPEPFVEIELSAAFLIDANNADGKLAIGGALTSLGTGSEDQYVFGSADMNPPLNYSQLILVPEPGMIVLLLTGAAAMFAFTRGRRMRRV